MVVEGKLELEMEGKVQICQVGEEICIPSGVVHSVRNIGGTTAKWLYGYLRAQHP
jgi:quercetin dioxygenase-like cupin family protein